MTPQQENKLKRIAALGEEGLPALLEYIFEIEEKIDVEMPAIMEVIATITAENDDNALLAKIEEAVKRATPEPLTDDYFKSIITPLIPEPLSGTDYVLTENDKKEIASKIKPTVVEKVIEKRTETIVKQPIDNTKYVENPYIPNLEEIAINTINTIDMMEGEDRIDAKSIKNIPTYTDEIKTLQNRTQILNQLIGGLDRRVNGLGTGSQNLQQVTDIGATTTTSITASSFIKTGGTSSEFLKANGTIDSSTYLTTSTASSTYIPYTGATGAIDLGNNSLFLGDPSYPNIGINKDGYVINSTTYTSEGVLFGSDLYSFHFLSFATADGLRCVDNFGGASVTIFPNATGRAMDIVGDVSMTSNTLTANNLTATYYLSGYAAVISDGFYTANFCESYGGYISDTTNTVTICNGTDALTVTGSIEFTADGVYVLGVNNYLATVNTYDINSLNAINANALTATGNVNMSGLNSGAGPPATILTNFNLYVDTTSGIVYVD